MSTSHLADLVRLFGWRDGAHHDRYCAELERTYLTAVAASINARLVRDARDRLEALPDDAYLRIIRGADTFFAARYGRSEDLARSVARWITVERAVLGEPSEHDGTLRAAGLDRRVEAAGGHIVAIDALPRIPATNITLDYTSELPSRVSTRFPNRTLVPPSPEEREATAEKLAAACQLLDAIAPLAADVVRRMIDVICCRTAVGDPRFYTASDCTTLGVVHLVNTHLDRKTAAEVASELVHEAIHQAVFRAELGTPLFVDRELADAPVVSPWTGAKLELYAYTHACFVWYGVANLWRLSSVAALPAGAYHGAASPASGGARSDAERCVEAIKRQRLAAELGFEKSPLACMGGLAERLPPELVATIDDMTREIVSPRAA